MGIVKNPTYITALLTALGETSTLGPFFGAERGW